MRFLLQCWLIPLAALLLPAFALADGPDSRAVQGAALNRRLHPHMDWWRGRRLEVCRELMSPEVFTSNDEEASLLRCLDRVPEGPELVADFLRRNTVEGKLTRLPSGLAIEARFARGKHCRGATLSRAGFADGGGLALVMVHFWFEGADYYLVRRGRHGWAAERTCHAWLE